MDADTVTAVCATVIAVLSLAVSIQQARAARLHNRQSVRPLLQLSHLRRDGGPTGIRLVNCGLGPAVVTGSVLRLDGVTLGAWDEATVNGFREGLVPVPAARTFVEGFALPAGYEALILSLDGFDRDAHADFWTLIRQRLELEIHYESLYSGDRYKAVLARGPRRGPDGRQAPPDP